MPAEGMLPAGVVLAHAVMVGTGQLAPVHLWARTAGHLPTPPFLLCCAFVPIIHFLIISLLRSCLTFAACTSSSALLHLGIVCPQ